MNSTIKVLISARYGSSRLSSKPLLILNDKPMYWHVVQRTLEVNIDIKNIVVESDDHRILESAFSLSIPALLTEVEHVSGTDSIHVSGTDSINEVVIAKEWKNDVVVRNVQGDEPLIPHQLISDFASFTCNNREFSITTVVSPINSEEDCMDFNVVKAVLGQENKALYFTRSPSPFNRNDSNNYSHVYRLLVYMLIVFGLFVSFILTLSQRWKYVKIRTIKSA